jgi:protoporphyrin/coproporphyrin ferrochelatase
MIRLVLPTTKMAIINRRLALISNNAKTGLLVANLGTPNSPELWDVFRYLNEFLTDPRVVDYPWLKRQLLVRGLIVPLRFRQSAELYKKLWTPEGSPLLVHGKAVAKQLQENLGSDFKVALGMRYQNPSIDSALEEIREEGVKEIIVFPLFPQYASATTGSVHQKVMESVKKWTNIPKMTFIDSYADHPALINAFCERARQYPIDSYDGIILSFHGLPSRQVVQANCKNRCLTEGCCNTLHKNNRLCYRAQCFATARAIAKELNLSDYKISFQSRLGKEPWIEPYTSDVIHQMAKEGKKRLLVLCPSFVCDCLETTCEISYEYAEEFKALGGEELQLVEGLNSHPSWIEAIREIILE